MHKRLTPNLHRMREAGSGDGETGTAAVELSAAGPHASDCGPTGSGDSLAGYRRHGAGD